MISELQRIGLACLSCLTCLTGLTAQPLELVWSDEFDYEGAPDPTKWTHETGAGGWGNQERQFYTDSLDNSRVEDGRLIIEVHQELEGRSATYTSARLITREKAQWKYGRIEARAKLPRTTGTWPAIWMLAADRLHGRDLWPDNGEIDIMEAVGYEQDPLFKSIVGDAELENVHGTLHTTMRHAGNGNGGSTFEADITEAFHVYAVNWTEDRIEFELDGDVYFTVERESVIPLRNPPDDLSPYWPFDQRFFLILNIAVGGTWGGHFNTNFYGNSPYGPDGIDHEGEWPQRMEVDYIRVYAYPDESEPTDVPGAIPAAAFTRADGILVETSLNTESPHNLSEIDAGDVAEFRIHTGAAGPFTLSAEVATPFGGSSLMVEVVETGSSLEIDRLPATGDWQMWETVPLGALSLPAGTSTLRLTTHTGGFNIASLDVQPSDGQIWHGLPVDADGNVNTGDWMGWFNVLEAPWLFSYSLENWVYLPALEQNTFTPESQWIYVFR